MNPAKLGEYIAYLEKKPRLYDEACREVPDLFIARMYRIAPCRMHIEMQRFLDANPVGGIFIPRNHGKTTQVTIGRMAWEIGRNPNMRIQIVQNTLPNARKTVGAIKETLESDAFRQVFPEIIPDRDDWGAGSLTVKRTKLGMRDSTVTAQPIFGKAGQRSDLLAFDDIEDFDNSIRQEGMRSQVKEAYRETWLPTLEPDGREWRQATPWHIDGITMDWVREGQSGTTPMFFRACEGISSSPWPEKFTPAVLKAYRDKMGEIAYSRAFCLRAMSGEEVVFRDSDLLDNACPLPDRARLRSPVRWTAIDLAFSDEERAIGRRGKDEADYSVMGIADLNADGHVYMVRVHRQKTSYPKFKQLVVSEAVRSGVRRAVIESNGPQKGLRQDLATELAKVGIATIVGNRRNDKFARASAVQNVVEQGRFHLRTGPDGELLDDMRPMYREMSMFPVAGKDDTVDVAVDLMAQSRIDGLPEPDKVYDNTALEDIKALHTMAVSPRDSVEDYLRLNEWGEDA
jgi:predicted phage terminase large subunit-like protein